MAVHVGDAGPPREQIAVGLLMLDQGLEAAAHGVLVAALDGMDVTRAEQGKEGQSSRSGVRIKHMLGRAALGLALLLEVQRPGAVCPLVPHDPGQTLFHGLLGVHGSPLAANELRPVQSRSAREWRRDLVGQSGEVRACLAAAGDRQVGQKGRTFRVGSRGAGQLRSEPQQAGNLGLGRELQRRVVGLQSEGGRVGALLLGERVARLGRLDQRRQIVDLARQPALDRPGVRGGTSDPDQQGQYQEQQGMEQKTQSPGGNRAEGVRIVMPPDQGRQPTLKSVCPGVGGPLCVHEKSRRR